MNRYFSARSVRLGLLLLGSMPVLGGCADTPHAVAENWVNEPSTRTVTQSAPMASGSPRLTEQPSPATRPIEQSSRVRFSGEATASDAVAVPARPATVVQTNVVSSTVVEPRAYEARVFEATAVAPVVSRRLTREQIIAWTEEGTRDDVIIDRIERSEWALRLSAADEMQMRRKGVSDDVIAAIKETTRR